MDISFFLYYIYGPINIHVAGENKPMCLEDVMQFLTGKRIIAPGDESVIQVLLIKATEDEFRRPALSSFSQKVTATLADEYKVMRDVWIEAVAQLIVGFTLNQEARNCSIHSLSKIVDSALRVQNHESCCFLLVFYLFA